MLEMRDFGVECAPNSLGHIGKGRCSQVNCLKQMCEGLQNQLEGVLLRWTFAAIRHSFFAD
eukprot:scaffold16006_cov70-Cyclotella_meneghiniana.AAC.5